MRATGKLAMGLSITSAALVTAWLLTGERKQKTKNFISKNTEVIQQVLKTERRTFDDSQAYYI